MRWAFPTAIDYYEALRPLIASSDAAVPAHLRWASDERSQVPLMCLSLDVGTTYTPVAVLPMKPLYQQATLCASDAAAGSGIGQRQSVDRLEGSYSEMVITGRQTVVRCLALSRRDLQPPRGTAPRLVTFAQGFTHPPARLDACLGGPSAVR